MVSGRNFSPEFGTDSSAMIVNETTAKQMGWGKDAVGHTITKPSNDGTQDTYHVIGVVQDFNFKSLHERIGPLMTVSYTHLDVYKRQDHRTLYPGRTEL